jgi:hypothetical protein
LSCRQCFWEKVSFENFFKKKKTPTKFFFSLEETVSHSNESITNEVGRKKKLFVCHLDWCRNLQSQFNTFNFFLLRWDAYIPTVCRKQNIKSFVNNNYFLNLFSNYIDCIFDHSAFYLFSSSVQFLDLL